MKDPSVLFRVIGSGQTWPEAQAMVTRWGLKNVHFETWVSKEVLPRRIAQADICLGIFGEGEKARRVIPHKIFQSMAMGKPVITLRTPAVEEFFSHRESVFLCSSPHPSELAQAISELKEDAALRSKIAEGGYRIVSRRFSAEAIGRCLLGILERHFHFSSEGVQP